jgi:cellulose synthase/poly-beta-1,6-N-acetylglucosamine synthase-like glycosyltransferase
LEVLYNNKVVNSPKVSIILLDWSCRKSFHSLDYLSNQTVPKNQYEVIWIEYYSRRSHEIEKRLKECEKLGKSPIVDKWIVMGMPDDIYYHKHLMYNIGIVASCGEIVTFCDSDAIFSPTFVESIIEAFNKDRNIVLHMDEVRNIDRRYYPFNYPSLEEVLSTECINWKDGKTTGLLDKERPLSLIELRGMYVRPSRGSYKYRRC